MCSSRKWHKNTRWFSLATKSVVWLKRLQWHSILICKCGEASLVVSVQLWETESMWRTLVILVDLSRKWSTWISRKKQCLFTKIMWSFFQSLTVALMTEHYMTSCPFWITFINSQVMLEMKSSFTVQKQLQQTLTEWELSAEPWSRRTKNEACLA